MHTFTDGSPRCDERRRPRSTLMMSPSGISGGLPGTTASRASQVVVGQGLGGTVRDVASWEADVDLSPAEM